MYFCGRMFRRKVKILSRIDKSVINDLPVDQFEGEVVIVNTVSDAQKAVEELMHEPYLGFDTETKPSFQRGVHYKVSLLQLSTQNKTFLFRLNLIGLPDCVINLLQNPSVIKVGLSTKDDFSALSARAPIAPAGFIEMQDYVKRIGIEEQGLQRLYALLFGKKISKAQRMSNWQAEPLLPAQITYAATDAWATLKMWLYLENLVTKRRLKVVQVSSDC